MGIQILILGFKGLAVTLGVPASGRLMEVGRSVEVRPKLAKPLEESSLF